MKKILLFIFLIFTLLSCTNANIISNNISKDAEQFRIERRVIFYNGITGNYILTIEGKCSLEHYNKKVAITCKTGEYNYKKHYLGLSDNVTYFIEQIESKKENPFYYKVIFKPKSIIPDIDFIK